MLNGRGKEMKEYKIDLSMYEGKVREAVSEAVQKKAFGLGYPGWISGRKPMYTECPFLYIENGHMLKDEDGHKSTFDSVKNTEISATDFLALTPEDVQDKPKEPEFKPFQKVLVRDYDSNVWVAHLYSHRDDNLAYIHRTVGDVGYHQCIPYEGNEHLLGTTKNVE
jgi:hypothetical protein